MRDFAGSALIACYGAEHTRLAGGLHVSFGFVTHIFESVMEGRVLAGARLRGRRAMRDRTAPRAAAFLGCGSSGGHSVGFAAGRRAAAAKLGQFGVPGVIAHLCASIADLRACAASNVMKLRMAEHQVVCGVGHLRAVEEHANVSRARMRPAFFQAIVDGVQARVMDFFATMDAFIHLRRLMFMNFRHGCVFRFGLRFVFSGSSTLGDRGLLLAPKSFGCR